MFIFTGFIDIPQEKPQVCEINYCQYFINKKQELEKVIREKKMIHW
jgi:hypothetical protein